MVNEESEDENDALMKEATENACHDLDIEDVEEVVVEEVLDQDEVENTVVEDVPDAIVEADSRDNASYRSRSGRVVKRQNYKSINRENMQLAQLKKTVKRIVKEKNPGVPSKKLKGEINSKTKSLNKGGFKDIFRRLTGAMFSQISNDGRFANTSLNEGVKRHGGKSIEALLTELSQLDNMDTFKPLMINELSKKERKMALNLLVIIREKRSGKIKGRVVADGRKQRDTVPREDAASPTIQLESLLISLLIDAYEGRDVAVSGVVGV